MYRISLMAPKGVGGQPTYMVRHFAGGDPLPTVGTEHEFVSRPLAWTDALGRAAKMSLMCKVESASIVETDDGRRFKVTTEEIKTTADHTAESMRGLARDVEE